MRSVSAARPNCQDQPPRLALTSILLIRPHLNTANSPDGVSSSWCGSDRNQVIQTKAAAV
ncbi:MAG: hypothetical protein AAF716_20440 [Cyanobacteria bacterium P01_D01_bin.1]